MAKSTNQKNITHATVRMYCMGTGDCFIIKFFSGGTEKFKLMIDCGVWSGKAENLLPYMENLKEYVNGSIDLLVITHEHKDHVSVFEACQELFTKNFEVKQIWMGWTENDKSSKIKKWKKDYGEKKLALAYASKKIESEINNPQYEEKLKQEMFGSKIFESKKSFSNSLKNFADLHMQAIDGEYKGLLEGMRIIKEEIANDNIEYLSPGDIKEDLPGLEGVKFYVLGPPLSWRDIEKESGVEGESYTHNKILKGTDAFSASILSSEASINFKDILPFEGFYETKESNTISEYKKEEEGWRNIDNDWLFCAGNLALRINSLTNNLSLALAIEFKESNKIMLFPGDAEYGSWASWHKIDWQGIKKPEDGVHFTQDLLRRTVFYKIAHHMSHNGTAQKLGLSMMTHKDLAAMATLDYDAIAPPWKNTMPNRAMLQELLIKTKGRVMIMKDSDLFYDFNGKEPLPDKIKEAQKRLNSLESKEYKQNYRREENNLFVEYTVKVSNIKE